MRINKILENYESVIWDWNGTLYDDAKVAARASARILEKAGRPGFSLEHYKGAFCFPLADYFKKLDLHNSSLSFQDTINIYRETFAEYATSISLNSDFFEFIEKSNTTIEHSILSLEKASQIKIVLGQENKMGLFSNILGTPEEKVKAGKELLLEVGDKKSILVGDTLYDAQVAQALDIDCLLVDCGHNSRARLQEIANEKNIFVL